MLRFLLRVLSVVLLAAAFASAVIDGTRSIAADAVTLTPFGDTCFYLFPKKFPQLRPFVESHMSRWAWDPVLSDLFRLPTWLVLGVLGTLLLWASKKRAPRIGYTSRP